MARKAKDPVAAAKRKEAKGPSLVNTLMKDGRGLRIGTFKSAISQKYIVRVNLFEGGFISDATVTTKKGKVRRARAANVSGTYAGARSYDTFEEAADKVRELSAQKEASGWNPVHVGAGKAPAFNVEDLA